MLALITKMWNNDAAQMTFAIQLYIMTLGSHLWNQ